MTERLTDVTADARLNDHQTDGGLGNPSTETSTSEDSVPCSEDSHPASAGSGAGPSLTPAESKVDPSVATIDQQASVDDDLKLAQRMGHVDSSTPASPERGGELDPDGTPPVAVDAEVVARLETLAQEISDLEGSIESQVLVLATKVREARALFDANVDGEASWAKWVGENLPFKVTRANQLLQIGNADSPKDELKRQRILGQARNKKYREKNKAQPSRDGDPGSSISQEVDDTADDPDRVFLKEWVVRAPIADIKRVKWFLNQPADVVEKYRQIADKPLLGIDVEVARDKHDGFGYHQPKKSGPQSTYEIINLFAQDMEEPRIQNDGSLDHEQ